MDGNRDEYAGAYACRGAILCMVMAFAGGGLVVLAAQNLLQQTHAFAVASVRPNNDGGVNLRGPRVLPDGSLVAPNVSLRDLIAFAYGLNLLYDRVEGKSDLLGQKFDVTAKAVSRVAATRVGEVGPINLMMQSLLAERFRLVVRVEQSRQTGYALVVPRSDGRLGPGFQVSDLKCPRDAEDPTPSSGDTRRCYSWTAGNELRGDGQSMSDIARTLGMILRRPVVDQTSVDGTFQVRMRFDQAGAAAFAGLRVNVREGDANLPSLFTAVQEQLGLKLEPMNVPVRVLVVQHVEPPLPN